MGLHRFVINGAIAATLTGALGGCAGMQAVRDDSRLSWLAASLAAELEALVPGDPRLTGAGPALSRVADALSQPEMGFSEPVAFGALERVEPAMVMPEDITAAGHLLALQAFTAPAISRAQPAAQAQLALAMGGFASPALAEAMWSEIQALEAATLTGLEAYTIARDAGVVLLVGPVASAEDAAQRCDSMAAFGLSCAAQPMPAGAARLGAPGGGQGGGAR